MKTLLLTIAMLLFSVKQYAQSVEMFQSTIEALNNKGFTKSDLVDTYNLLVKEGEPDSIIRDFLPDYFYFISIIAEDGVDDLDSYIYYYPGGDLFQSNETEGYRSIHHWFSPNYAGKRKIVVKAYKTKCPTCYYIVTVRVFARKKS
ncbi:MAG: hypothetical protein QM564_05555 [Bergeyella sp.]